jgi:hypothetical protein
MIHAAKRKYRQRYFEAHCSIPMVNVYKVQGRESVTGYQPLIAGDWQHC